jgi:hypothetical protein
MVEEERRIRRADELTKARREEISKDVKIAQLEASRLELETIKDAKIAELEGRLRELEADRFV